MNKYEQDILKAQELGRFTINSSIMGTKEEFIKSTIDDLRRDGFEGDKLVEKAKEKLSGGKWVTINGNHVYIKDGKVEAGAAYTGDSDNPKVTPGEKVKKEGSKDGGKKQEEDKDDSKGGKSESKFGKEAVGKTFKTKETKARGRTKVESIFGNNIGAGTKASMSGELEVVGFLPDEGRYIVEGRDLNAPLKKTSRATIPIKEFEDKALFKKEGVKKSPDFKIGDTVFVSNKQSDIYQQELKIYDVDKYTTAGNVSNTEIFVKNNKGEKYMVRPNDLSKDKQ